MFKFCFDLLFGKRTAVFIGLQFKNGLNIFFNGQRPKNAVFLRKVGNTDAGALVDGKVLDLLAV